MAGYLGRSSGVVQVDGYTRAEADAAFIEEDASGNVVVPQDLTVGRHIKGNNPDIDNWVSFDLTGGTIGSNGHYLMLCKTTASNVRIVGTLSGTRASNPVADGAAIIDFTFFIGSGGALTRSAETLSGNGAYGRAAATFVTVDWDNGDGNGVASWYALRLGPDGYPTDLDFLNFRGWAVGVDFSIVIDNDASNEAVLATGSGGAKTFEDINIGINEANPQYNLDVNGNVRIKGNGPQITVHEGTVEPGMKLANTNYSEWDIFSGGGGGASYENYLTFYQRTLNGGSTKGMMLQHGNMLIPSGGVKFSEAGSVFDEYEVGQCSIEITSNGGTTTPSAGPGVSYIRIGNYVHLYGYVQFNNIATVHGGNIIYIGGFPFSTSSKASTDIPVWFWNISTHYYNDGYPSISVSGNGGTAYWHRASTATPITGNMMGNNAYINFDFGYNLH